MSQGHAYNVWICFSHYVLLLKMCPRKGQPSFQEQDLEAYLVLLLGRYVDIHLHTCKPTIKCTSAHYTLHAQYCTLTETCTLTLTHSHTHSLAHTHTRLLTHSHARTLAHSLTQTHVACMHSGEILTLMKQFPQISTTSTSSEYSPLQPTESDPQEGYMYMEKQDVSA